MSTLFTPFSSEDDYLDKKDVVITDTLPWIEKYRPSSLEGIISHSHIINALKNFIKYKNIPHMLFYGPSGVGKTSVVMACAKELYGKNMDVMVLELNASDERGIEVVRTRIKEFVSSKNIYCYENNNLFKLVILDEVDAMTGDAQAILRKVVEDYTKTARFCLICNYINKVSPALYSRCVTFRFSPLLDTDMLSRIHLIAKNESLSLSEDGINTIMKRSHGDMRKVLNIMQAVNSVKTTKIINSNMINQILCYPSNKDIQKIINLLMTKSFVDGFEELNNLKLEFGLSLSDIIQEIHSELLDNVLNDNQNDNINLDIKEIMQVFEKMKDLEYNLSICTSELNQTSALVGIFQTIRT